VSYAYLGTLIIAIVVGFLAGFMLFKRSHNWCPGCGTNLRCTQCAGQPTAHEARESIGTRR
jgi:hypothetical protein